MKSLSVVLVLAAFVLTGCHQNELSKEEAAQLITAKFGFPRVVGRNIHRGEPRHAKRLLKEGLDKAGLVTVLRTHKLKDDSRPIIHFTRKAEPFLIYMPPDDLEYFTFDIQKVKLGEEDFEEITSIIPNKNKDTIVVAYTTVYKNITPFALLAEGGLHGKEHYKAYFMLSKKGWKIIK